MIYPCNILDTLEIEHLTSMQIMYSSMVITLRICNNTYWPKNAQLY